MDWHIAEFLTKQRKVTVVVCTQQAERLYFTSNYEWFLEYASYATGHVYDCYIAYVLHSFEATEPLECDDVTFAMTDQIGKAATTEIPIAYRR